MFSENLKTARAIKGLTQAELAIRLNVVRQTISKWEKGRAACHKKPSFKINTENCAGYHYWICRNQHFAGYCRCHFSKPGWR